MAKEDVVHHGHKGMEALRIIAMIMIVGIHYLGHGNGHDGILKHDPQLWNYWIACFFEACGSIGVNCYVLISGYFLLYSKRFSYKKAAKLWGQVFFYSVGIYLLLLVIGWMPFSPKLLFELMLPVKFGNYWFVAPYIGLYLLYPYLNVMAIGMEKEKYQKFLMLLIAILSIYSFIVDSFHVSGGYSLIWFIALYFIAAYLRRFEISFSKKKLMLFYLGISLFILMTKFCLYTLSLKYGFDGKGSNYFLLYNSPTILASSIIFFLMFKDFRIENSRWIRIIDFFAPLTFGVYLISDHACLKTIIWDQWIKAGMMAETPYFLIHFFVSVLLVFFVCALLEKVRQGICSYFFGNR